MKRRKGEGWVQPRPGSQQVPGRAHSAFLSVHLPKPLPQGTHDSQCPTLPAPAWPTPSRPTLLTFKGPRKGPVSLAPGSSSCRTVCLPVSGECGGSSFRLPLPTPPDTLTPPALLPWPPQGSPAAVYLTLPAHKTGACTPRPSASWVLTHTTPTPQQWSRENHALLPPGPGREKGEGAGPGL